MPDDAGAAAPSPFEASMERLRDAAKWLVGAAAAVGAILIAGSQLSSMGRLPLGPRLGFAVLGVVVALVAIVFAVWSAVQILIPVGVTLTDLQRGWDAAEAAQEKARTKTAARPAGTQSVSAEKAAKEAARVEKKVTRAEKRMRADVRFFRQNPRQLGSYGTPAQLAEAKSTAWRQKQQAEAALKAADEQDRPDRERAAEEAEATYERVVGVIDGVLQAAQYQVLQDRFHKVLRKLLSAAAVAAFGIMLFAWAANPPAGPTSETSLTGASLRNADLRDADLVGADLRDADLTGADLTGADLSDARVDDVTWSGTTCPDGTDSEDNDGTCRGHLSP